MVALSPLAAHHVAGTTTTHHVAGTTTAHHVAGTTTAHHVAGTTTAHHVAGTTTAHHRTLLGQLRQILPLLVAFTVITTLFLAPAGAHGGMVVRDFQDNLTFEINFEGSYSEITTQGVGNLSILSFKASEDIIFDNTSYLYQQVTRSYLEREGDSYRLVTEFRHEPPVTPLLEKTETGIAITYVGVGLPAEEDLTTGDTPSLGTFSVRALVFLTVFIGLALGLVWILKKSFRRVAITEVRGVARVLGRLDIQLRKSLYFCEVGDKVYILGVTDDNISVVDTLEGEEEISRIKAGFSRREDFGSYLRFFNTRNDTASNISGTVPAGSGSVADDIIADSISVDTNRAHGNETSRLGSKWKERTSSKK